MADTFDDNAPSDDLSTVDEGHATEAEGASDDDLLELARKRFELAKDAEKDIRKDALDDLNFISGKQWPDDIRHEREQDGRPCLTINRLPQFVQQITNDQRQNRPGIHVHPMDNAASEETAEIIQGLIRHIQYNSNADTARDTAFDAAARGGFGFYRVTTGYVSPDSFEQEIFVKRIRNQFAAFLDPYHQEPDGSDAEWGFIFDDVSKDSYLAQYPESKLAKSGEWEAFGNRLPDWVKSDSVRIAEYFYKEYVPGKIHLLSTGETVKDEDLEDRVQAAMDAGIMPTVVNSRSVKIPKVRWIKMNGDEVLDRTDWKGSYIPLIPVYGQEYFIDGKRVLEGVARHAKDPQRALNVWKSAQAEAIALAPKAPFIGAEGQFEGHEAKWRAANRKNHAFLEYKPVSLNGQPQPPPQRSAIEPAVQAITQAAMEAGEDLKATTGIYDPSLGAQSNEIAGVAIKARNRQSQTSNFHFTDNLTRSMKHEGRIIVDLLPHIYDSERAARIIGDDGTHKVVQLNQKHKDDSGKEVLYDVTAGRYDVTIDIGPSYATKREEAADNMLQLMQAMPQQAQYFADIVVRNMDTPGAKELSERLQKMLPPQLQEQGNMKDVPPQLIAQMQQMDQQNKQLTEHLNEAVKVIETKKLDLESRERIETMKLQVEAEIAMAKLGSTESIALLQAKFNEMEHRLELLKMSQPVDAPEDFDPSQADGGNYAGVGHIGGSANLTGEESPGSPVEGN